jgi:pimeloyl-ACP methyl ester carboxylesterase
MKQIKTLITKSILSTLIIISVLLITFSNAQAAEINQKQTGYPTLHKTVQIDGLEIFYREAGPKDAPTILLLHGFPTSSHMFRNLISELSEDFHLIAPDYPGFGFSSMPTVTEFEYSFDNLANIVDKFTKKIGLKNYSLYLQDYGAPVGFRLFTKNPKNIEALIIQNGNAYDEGLRDFWIPLKAYWKDKSDKNAEPLKGFLTLETTKWQFTHGVRNTETISPDNWGHVQPLLDRPGNEAIQLELFYSYGSNPPLYPKWQAYLRNYQPPTLIVWGKNDYIFPAEGAYKRDLNNIDFNILDTGHFALEEDLDVITKHIRDFFSKKVAMKTNN